MSPVLESVDVHWQPPADLDPECLALCRAVNETLGVQTIESCCGHGRDPFRIWLVVERLEQLPPLCYHFDVCHCGHGGWQVIAQTDCGMSPVTFMIEGPVGAYEQADEIARFIIEEVNR